MSEVKIQDEIRVDAPALEVWEAIKDPARHARWTRSSRTSAASTAPDRFGGGAW
jgi:uncharacterized protein YndB with AHSA1/START domain